MSMELVFGWNKMENIHVFNGITPILLERLKIVAYTIHQSLNLKQTKTVHYSYPAIFDYSYLIILLLYL